MKNNTRILFAVFGLLAALSPEVLRAGVDEWTSSGPEFGVVAALAAHSSNPSTVYATASPSPDVTYRRLYKSVDAGANWAATGLFGYFDLVVPTSEPSTAYATTTNVLPGTFHRTSDGGKTWVDRAGPHGSLLSATADRTTRWFSTR